MSLNISSTFYLDIFTYGSRMVLEPLSCRTKTVLLYCSQYTVGYRLEGDDRPEEPQ
jgi:hypothetical protein